MVKTTRSLLSLSLLIALAASCASDRARQTTDREPALQSTTTDDEDLDALFEKFMKSAHPETELQNYLNRQTELYVKGFAFMREFDRDLDRALTKQQAAGTSSQPVTISNLPSYARLLGLRSVSHRSEHRIRFIYGKLIFLAANRTADFDEADFQKPNDYKMAMAVFEARRIASRDILDRFNKNLRSRKKSETELQKLAIGELEGDIVDEINKFTAARNQRKKTPVPQEDEVAANGEFKKLLANNFRGAAPLAVTTAQLAQSSSVNASLIERAGVTANQYSDPELQEQIKQVEDELRLHAMAQELNEISKRTPNAKETIHPDVGADGNLTGNTFPENTWALTYDDGPSTLYTPKDLKNLEDNQIKATFFWLTENVRRYGDVVASVIAAGMPVETHSYTHPNMPALKAAAWDREITKADQENAAIYGKGHEPGFYRLPYAAGMQVAGIRQRIAARHEVHVFWNVDSLDWQDRNPNTVFQRTIKQMKLLKRGIILFHDIHPQSVEASRMMIEWSKKQNDAEADITKKIRWVTIPEIVEELNK